MAQQDFNHLRVAAFRRQLNRHGTASPARVGHRFIDDTGRLGKGCFDPCRIHLPDGGSQSFHDRPDLRVRLGGGFTRCWHLAILSSVLFDAWMRRRLTVFLEDPGQQPVSANAKRGISPNGLQAARAFRQGVRHGAPGIRRVDLGQGKQGIVEGEPAPRPRPVFVTTQNADAFVHAPVQMAVTPDLY